jgi:phospholipid/cholesterol/gamma-HCH transport system substrate-binding protein
METRSNHILVGAVVLLLIAALIGFTAWLAGSGGGATKQYDIFFKQVEGIAKGSSVSFNGVPSGSVQELELWKENPEFVRVRIAIKEAVPVLIGTTAAIQGVGFTGASQVVLAGAVKGAPPITEIGPAGVPMIPTRTAGLGAILNNAPMLLERLTTLTERLTEVLSDKNQQSLGNILGNIDQLTRSMKATGPGMERMLVETQLAARQAALAANRFGALASSAQGNLDGMSGDARLMIADMRKTVAAAEQSLARLDATIAEAKPGLSAFSSQTVPELGQLIRDLRQASEALGSAASKIDQQGLGTLFTGKALPDYAPAKASKK